MFIHYILLLLERQKRVGYNETRKRGECYGNTNDTAAAYTTVNGRKCWQIEDRILHQCCAGCTNRKVNNTTR